MELAVEEGSHHCAGPWAVAQIRNVASTTVPELCSPSSKYHHSSLIPPCLTVPKRSEPQWSPTTTSHTASQPFHCALQHLIFYTQQGLLCKHLLTGTFASSLHLYCPLMSLLIFGCSLRCCFPCSSLKWVLLLLSDPGSEPSLILHDYFSSFQVFVLFCFFNLAVWLFSPFVALPISQ